MLLHTLEELIEEIQKREIELCEISQIIDTKWYRELPAGYQSAVSAYVFGHQHGYREAIKWAQERLLDSWRPREA